MSEFEAGALKTADVADGDDDEDDVSGDVKYHHGATGTYVTPIGTQIQVLHAKAIALADGESRTFLADGDRVTLHGWCERDNRKVG